MTDQLKSGSRQGFLAISVCVVGISSSPLFYKLAYATGMSALWVNVFRLLITTVIMAAITFLSPKNRKAIFSTSRRAFLISALAGTLLAFHLNGWALAFGAHGRLRGLLHFGNLCAADGVFRRVVFKGENVQSRTGWADHRNRRRGCDQLRRRNRPAEREYVRAVCRGHRSAVPAVRAQGARGDGRDRLHHDFVFVHAVLDGRHGPDFGRAPKHPYRLRAVVGGCWRYSPRFLGTAWQTSR